MAFTVNCNQHFREGNMNLYIIEDDHIQLQLLKKALTAEFSLFNVLGFTNVDDCLVEISLVKNQPTLIITDVLMPDKSGVQLIKELGKYPCIVGLLIVSGAGKHVLEVLSLMASYMNIPYIKTLTKPLAIAEVVNIVDIFQARYQKISLKKKPPVYEAYSKNELLTFIVCEQFHCFYQLQVNSRTGNVDGLELLGRLIIDGELIPPDNFIPDLIKTSLITQYTYFILEVAIQQLKQANLPST